MLLKIIMGITDIIVTLALYYVTTPAVDKRRGKYFGVNISVTDNEQLLRLIENYQKTNKHLLSGLLILAVLSFFYRSSTPIIMTYVVVFTVGLVGFYASMIKYTMQFDRLVLNSAIDQTIVDKLKNWRYGIFYYNESDNRVMVAQRFGLGTTMNLAKPLGKAINIAAIILIVIIHAYITYTTVGNDLIAPHLTISKDAIHVASSSYSETIDIEAVEAVELVEANQVDIMFKTNGIGTEKYSRGYYDVQNLGNCFVCIYKSSPLIVMIKTEDKNALYSMKTAEETEAVYRKLLERLNQE